jgi:hypothetical protein
MGTALSFAFLFVLCASSVSAALPFAALRVFVFHPLRSSRDASVERPGPLYFL